MYRVRVNPSLALWSSQRTCCSTNHLEVRVGGLLRNVELFQ